LQVKKKGFYPFLFFFTFGLTFFVSCTLFSFAVEGLLNQLYGSPFFLPTLSLKEAREYATIFFDDAPFLLLFFSGEKRLSHETPPSLFSLFLRKEGRGLPQNLVLLPS